MIIKEELALQKLQSVLADAESAVIALSGGTDSMFLVHFASQVKEFRMLAVTVNSPYMFGEEVNDAVTFCSVHAVPHRIIAMEMPASVRNNPPDRCYLCKKEVMRLIADEASRGEYSYIFDGTNADDISDHRPGMRALKELGIRSPLLEAGMTKAMIRHYSEQAGLKTWDKPSNACLMTRFPHGVRVTENDLRKAEAAEVMLASQGFRGARVRVHGDVARIECISDQFNDLLSDAKRKDIAEGIRKIGYTYVTVDLEGYRSGSMNTNK